MVIATSRLLGGLGRVLLGPVGPVLISAVVVLAFALPYGWKAEYSVPPAQGASLACSVERIVDGDTVDVGCPQGSLRVRIWGIDAPETGQTPWGDRSRRHLESLLRKQQVRILVEDLDKYGRVVARLYQGNLDVGLRMVKDGQATVRTRYVRDQLYRDTRVQARAEGTGIWSRPGSHQKPWQWRRLNPSRPPGT